MVNKRVIFQRVDGWDAAKNKQEKSRECDIYIESAYISMKEILNDSKGRMDCLIARDVIFIL